MRITADLAADHLTQMIDGHAVVVPVRRSARARRMILRMDAARGGPLLTLPAAGSLAEARRFLDTHSDWLRARLAQLPEARPFADGAVFPLRGEACHIVHRGERGLIRLDAAQVQRVIVPGAAAHLPRRLTDWLRGEARGDLAAAVSDHTATIGATISALRVGDAKSRWGSCSRRGVLSFSWRLVLAPPFVLDYLAAHEVAHLAQMNHGPAFWQLVARLDPKFETARAWLKIHGPGLHAIGRAAP
ncbi:MAG TPA: SprT family zinc-dependent metalloprotease [Afifellaceae bacterium]|nr:SprT family zinc-dependent metalloprotease [Afifellaceae bacterium]